MLRNLWPGLFVVGTAVFGSSVGTVVESRPPSPFSYASRKCMTSETDTSIIVGGVTVGTVADAEFTAGSSCTVIPPPDVPSSVALRCAVATGTATITASTGLTLGTTAPAGEWCVEVRTVAP